MARWYVWLAEAFARALEGQKLRELDAAEVNRYLKDLGRKNRIEDWQFLQAAAGLTKRVSGHGVVSPLDVR